MDYWRNQLSWKMISDPIYGYVYFNTEIEEPIINNILLQRLRYIMQLQTAHFVYPGAVHTRFQHSIGVMHLAGLMAEDMLSKIVFLYGEHVLEGYKPATLIQASRLAGLLHDIGHAAFSHAFEYGLLWKKNLPREVSNHEEIGLYLVREMLDEYIEKVEKEYLSGLREVLYDILESRETKGIIKILRWIVKEGYYPADILDFLRRDSYYAGTTEYGTIMYERLYKYTYPLIDRDYSLMLDRTAIGEFKQYMWAKANMYRHVYYHSVCRSFDKILYEVLEQLDHELDLTGRVLGLLKGDYNGYLELTDALLYSTMMNKAIYDNTRLGYLCRKILLERKPEWKRIGKEASITASMGTEVLRKILVFILDHEYRSNIIRSIVEYLEDQLKKKTNLRENEIWLDVLDVTPLSRSVIYPMMEEVKPITMYIGKKTGRDLNILEELNVFTEELPLEILFRLYVIREKYSGELESTLSSILVDAITNVLEVDLEAYKKISEKVYIDYKNRDYSKYRLTM